MRTTTALIAAFLLTGCAPLNVSWSLTASYNTNAQTVTRSGHATSPDNEK
jgi:hypothetical protein